MRSISLQELAELASARGVTIGALALEWECQEAGEPAEALRGKMGERLRVMREAVARGLQGVKSRSGLTGGDAKLVAKGLAANASARLVGGEPLTTAISYALAVSEVNASMGRIVAAPTGGSCGILPGVLLSVGERVGATDESLIDALFTAGAAGSVIARRATVSGAAGGCQAECGSAAAMAAAAAVQLGGGTPQQCVQAVALSLKGLMGLVCDPVAGLVEVPCIKRNATSAGVALAAATMALAGVRSVVPPDEVVDAMGAVGRELPASLKETAVGGLAATPTGKRIAGQV
ncbi:MAG: L-serine ammonia-lyase, iron-sulfur-dependent, subunit alpha [Bacillota bacterium]|jgi:L-serine dehydratase|nr:L-serine ammonia-lyase, iron-sulfur-dependent, subunit alpha [Bacillota bacterium]